MLPVEMARGERSTVVTFALPLVKLFHYEPAKGAVWAFQPRQHFGFEAAA